MKREQRSGVRWCGGGVEGEMVGVEGEVKRE